MTKAAEQANLAEQKLMLAKKYIGRSNAANSKPLKAKHRRAADKYLRLAKQYGAKV